MRIIRLSSPDSANLDEEFVNEFQDNIILHDKSRIALGCATIPLDLTPISIDSLNNQFAVSDGGAASRTITLTTQALITHQELADDVTDKLNSNFSDGTPGSVDAGIEYKANIDNGIMEIVSGRAMQLDGDSIYAAKESKVNFDASNEWVQATDLGTDLKHWVSFSHDIVRTCGYVHAQMADVGDIGICILPSNEIPFLNNDLDITSANCHSIRGDISNTRYIYNHEGTAYYFATAPAVDHELYVQYVNDNVIYEVHDGNGSVLHTATLVNSLNRNNRRFVLQLYNATSKVQYPTYTPSPLLAPAEMEGASFTYDFTALPETGVMLGYKEKTKTVKCSPDAPAKFRADKPPRASGDVPSIAIEITNLDLESYDGEDGRRHSYLYVLPSIARDDYQISITPPTLWWVNINNMGVINLSRLGIRLVTNQNRAYTFRDRIDITVLIE